MRQRDEGLPSPSKTRLSDDKVKRAIDRRVQATLTAKTFLDAVADVHQELSAEEVPIESWPPALENSVQGGRLAVVEEALEAEQRNFEAVLAHAIAAQVLDGLQKEPEFEKLLGTL